MNEYNPDWHKDGTLVWNKIGEKTGKGKRVRKQKQYNRMDISKVIVPDGMKVDKEVLEASRRQYEETGIMIPVFLSYGFVLIAGYEQYVLAQELGLNEIAFHRITKMNKKEKREFKKMVCHRAVGNKKYPVKTNDGNKIYITYAQRKLLNSCFGLARKAQMKIEITPTFEINILYMDGTVYKQGLNLYAAKTYLKSKNK